MEEKSGGIKKTLEENSLGCLFPQISVMEDVRKHK